MVMLTQLLKEDDFAKLDLGTAQALSTIIDAELVTNPVIKDQLAKKIQAVLPYYRLGTQPAGPAQPGGPVKPSP
jgi:hypothetical protein